MPGAAGVPPDTSLRVLLVDRASKLSETPDLGRSAGCPRTSLTRAQKPASVCVSEREWTDTPRVTQALAASVSRSLDP